MIRNIQVILFDLGGVLLELGPSPVPAHALPDGSSFDLRNWFHSETAIAFETGRIDASRFAQTMVDELELDCGRDELIEFFTAWPRGLYPGVPELLNSLRENYLLAVLSNTNALHWPRLVDEFDLPRRVDAVFASHRLGLAKPEAGVYRHVSDRLGAAPRSILFLDDNVENVDAAAALGFQARLVRGFGELEETLRSLGLL